jgi:hypothetical protein
MALTAKPTPTTSGFMNYFLNTDPGASNNGLYADREDYLLIVAR